MMPNRPQNNAPIIIVDVGTGNIRSVHKAFLSLGASTFPSFDRTRILGAAKIVLPGVGAFGDFMTRLRNLDLIHTIYEAANLGIPILGICVGMQALFEASQEMGDHQGLGVLRGTVKLFPRKPGLKIPQTGWNQITNRTSSRLFVGLPLNPYVFYNHAYYCEPQDIQDISATTEYGIQYCSAVERNNIFGVQFHPEKSQTIGLKILQNYISL